MKSELKHFDRVNKNLVLIVDDMRMRQEGLKKMQTSMSKQLAEQQAEMARIQDNVVDVFTHGIGDFKKLKRAVVRLYRSWVQEERGLMQGGGSETDTKMAYKQNRTYLEQSIQNLRSKLKSVNKNNSKENKRILKDNVVLI